jgi:DNA-directed RNA polymerase specialized sigma24 family protein
MDDSVPTSPTLLERAADPDDRQAGEMLVHIYLPLVYAFARRRLGPNDADDVTQTVFLNLFKALRTHFVYYTGKKEDHEENHGFHGLHR